MNTQPPSKSLSMNPLNKPKWTIHQNTLNKIDKGLQTVHLIIDSVERKSYGAKSYNNK